MAEMQSLDRFTNRAADLLATRSRFAWATLTVATSCLGCRPAAQRQPHPAPDCSENGDWRAGPPLLLLTFFFLWFTTCWSPFVVEAQYRQARHPQIHTKTRLSFAAVLTFPLSVGEPFRDSVRRPSHAGDCATQ